MSVSKESPARVIVVSGMHRSGTSVVTRCLHLLGADIAQEIIPTDEAVNRDGFFEDAHVVALDDELLSVFGGNWYDYRPLQPTPERQRDLELWQERAFAHLRAEYAGNKISVLKDPRMMRLWEYWAPVFERAGMDVELLLVVRRPVEVALSLKRRNGIPPAYGMLLWCAHMLEWLNAINVERAWPAIFYQSLVTDPQKHLAIMAGLISTSNSGVEEFTHLEREISNPGCSDSTGFIDELTLLENVKNFSGTLYRVVENHCTDDKLSISRVAVQQLNGEYQSLLTANASALQTLRVLTGDLIALNTELIQIGELHSTAQSVVACRDQQLAELNREITRVGAELEHAQSIVVERDDQLAGLNEKVQRFENVWYRRAIRYSRRPFR